MAKSRMINTKFWDDNYTSNLDPIEKLLFLYFLTNTSTNISGVYEIPLKKVALETGIDKEMVIKVIERFSNDGKIFYVDGWIALKNFVKNQNQRSPTVQAGIKAEIANVPNDILEKLKGYGYGIDTLSHLTKSNLTKSNLTKQKEDTPIGASIPSKAFIKPTLEEVKAYCEERKNKVDPQDWMDHYTSNGWKVGRNPMKDWKAAVRTWEKDRFGSPAKKVENVFKNKENNMVSKLKTTKV